MIKKILLLIHLEILMTMRQAFSWLTPMLFFSLVICLFTLALGPDEQLLKKLTPSIIWVAAILSILISINNLFHTDKESGFLDCVLLSPHPSYLLVLAKVISHWILYCLPLVIISPMLGFLLNLSTSENMTMTITLLLGTPVLSLIGAIGAALVAGIRNSGLLLPIIIMPLYIPVLIFSTGAITAIQLGMPAGGYYAVLAALLLLTLATAPLFTGIALKVGANQQ